MKDLVYFKDVIGYGDLYIDYIIIEDDYPLLFILKNKHNDRFICSCFEIIKQQSWVINKVTISDIKDLLTDKIDIRKAFLFDNDNKKIIVHKKNNQYVYEIVDKEYIINNDIIPDEGDYLESDENEFNEYIINLKKDENNFKILLYKNKLENDYLESNENKFIKYITNSEKYKNKFFYVECNELYNNLIENNFKIEFYKNKSRKNNIISLDHIKLLLHNNSISDNNTIYFHIELSNAVKNINTTIKNDSFDDSALLTINNLIK